MLGKHVKTFTTFLLEHKVTTLNSWRSPCLDVDRHHWIRKEVLLHVQSLDRSRTDIIHEIDSQKITPNIKCVGISQASLDIHLGSAWNRAWSLDLAYRYNRLPEIDEIRFPFGILGFIFIVNPSLFLAKQSFWILSMGNFIKQSPIYNRLKRLCMASTKQKHAPFLFQFVMNSLTSRLFGGQQRTRVNCSYTWTWLVQSFATVLFLGLATWQR